MAVTFTARVLIAGHACGEVLRLAEPIGFWGGVDAKSGRIVQPAHADCGTSITDKVLVLPGTIGSSSSSAVFLEMIRKDTAPRAVVMAAPDAILALGAVVAGELDLPRPPFLCADIDMFRTGQRAEIDADGAIRLTGPADD